MNTVVLGRTGLDVSVAGLGCGGHSRLGQAHGASEGESIALVRRALDLGVTFIDTAAAYATEEIVGRAIEGRGDGVVVSTKVVPHDAQGPLSAIALRRSVESSLRRLRRDRIDVFHLHGLPMNLYQHACDELVPEMLRLRDGGELRFLAISEPFAKDPGHEMLTRALADDCWDVVMAGFNLLNQSARHRLFARTVDQGVGVVAMFAVRRALSDPDELRRVVADLVARGHTNRSDIDPTNPLGFLTADGGARSVVDAGYRFARHEPGVHVVLTGTGNVAHLEQNVTSLEGPPLRDVDLDRVQRMFGSIDFVSGN